MYWTDTADGHHCTRHDYAFKRGEVCHRCVTDPGEELGGIADDDTSELRARISEYRTNARTALRKSAELYERDEWSPAAKYEDTAIKWARLAEERQDILDSREHDLKLIRHEQEMSGLRGNH